MVSQPATNAATRSLPLAPVSCAAVAAKLPLACSAGSAGAGDATEHRTGNKTSAARVVEIENAAHHLAGAKKPGDEIQVDVKHLSAFRLDAQAAKREGDAAGCL